MSYAPQSSLDPSMRLSRFSTSELGQGTTNRGAKRIARSKPHSWQDKLSNLLHNHFQVLTFFQLYLSSPFFHPLCHPLPPIEQPIFIFLSPSSQCTSACSRKTNISFIIRFKSLSLREWGHVGPNTAKFSAWRLSG